MLCCRPAHAQEQQQGAPPCGGEAITRGIVSRVTDGRTFTLDDGREVRLAAVEVPSLPLPKEVDPAPRGAAAKDAMAALVGSDEIVLRQAGTAADRYGRTVAYAYAVRDGAELFLPCAWCLRAPLIATTSVAWGQH